MIRDFGIDKVKSLMNGVKFIIRKVIIIISYL
jgi:hypothetical protein